VVKLTDDVATGILYQDGSASLPAARRMGRGRDDHPRRVFDAQTGDARDRC
jgi:hypothetical protein